MSTKGILFNTAEVRAILGGRKTVTRRVVKPQPEMQRFEDHEALAWVPPAIVKGWEAVGVQYTEYLKTPYRPGDILYVRETWEKVPSGYVYRASVEQPGIWQWRHSIHMPRDAARIWLRVTDVRVERLREMTYIDVWKEGLIYKNESSEHEVIERFIELWDSTIKPADRERYGWEANPWVWVIAFERCAKPEES